jgi:hypothetical protein
MTFHPPSGVVLVNIKGGVEIEAGGATHYVNAVSAGSNWLECKWHAAKRLWGDNGLAKGYCWVQRQ